MIFFIAPRHLSICFELCFIGVSSRYLDTKLIFSIDLTDYQICIHLESTNSSSTFSNSFFTVLGGGTTANGGGTKKDG